MARRRVLCFLCFEWMERGDVIQVGEGFDAAFMCRVGPCAERWLEKGRVARGVFVGSMLGGQ